MFCIRQIVGQLDTTYPGKTSLFSSLFQAMNVAAQHVMSALTFPVIFFFSQNWLIKIRHIQWNLKDITENNLPATEIALFLSQIQYWETLQVCFFNSDHYSKGHSLSTVNTGFRFQLFHLMAGNDMYSPPCLRLFPYLENGGHNIVYSAVFKIKDINPCKIYTGIILWRVL